VKTKLITEKIANHLGIKPSGIVIGDLRDEMARDMLRAVESAVNKHQRKPKMWILVHAKAQTSQKIKTTVMVFEKLPPKQLGTICFFINNRSGEVRLEWVLPLDIPRPDGLVSDTGTRRVAEDAKGMPVIYG